MKSRRRQSPHRVLVTSAILALVVAAALVGYLEYRAAVLQRQQTHIIVQQICERAASALAARIRHLFDIAFSETIEGIGHPQMMNYNVPRMATFFANGHERHPFVDRFFIWSANRSPLWTDQVVFYSPTTESGTSLAPIVAPDGRELGSLVAEPELGREILRLARAQSATRTFLAVEQTVGSVPYQLIIHTLWSSDLRRDFTGLIGYTVDLRKIDGDLFHKLLADEITAFLNPDARAPQLAATVLDETGRVIYGEPVLAGVPSAAAPVDMLFFPHEQLSQWSAGRPPPRLWHVVVTAPPVDTWFGGKWVVTAVVLLIVIAVICAVAVERQAVRLSQMQADFVANASHQLKTPLSLLSTAIETLCLDRVPPERMKEYYKILQSQARRMTDLVDRILQFSRVGGAPDIFRMEPVNLVTLVDRVVDRFRTENHQGPVPITLEHGPTAVLARADAGAIEQAVVNLLENAVKYGDERNRVSVRVDCSNGHAAISVRDQGFGIHSRDLPHVFDKFYRGRMGGDGRPGFGVGLALVESVARAHGGRAAVQTSYGQGSEFTILIPAISEGAADAVPHSRH